MAYCHHRSGGPRFHALGGIGENAHICETGDEIGHWLVDLHPAFCDQQHRRHSRDRLCHRKDAEQRMFVHPTATIQCDRAAADIIRPVCPFADRNDGAGNGSVVYDLVHHRADGGKASGACTRARGRSAHDPQANCSLQQIATHKCRM